LVEVVSAIAAVHIQAILRLAIRSFVENHDARTDEFCAPSEYPTNSDIFGNGGETKPIVQRFGNPALSLGDVAKVDTAMAIRYGVIVVLAAVRGGDNPPPRQRHRRTKSGEARNQSTGPRVDRVAAPHSPRAPAANPGRPVH